MDLNKLNEILTDQPAYRTGQIKEAVYKSSVDDWDEAIGLPRELRRQLKEKCPLDINAEIFVSDDGNSQKAVVSLVDGLKIETVLMRHDNRNTVCVSSQVGCPMACSFCATGKMGFKRNLAATEIVEQAVLFARALKNLCF